MGTQATIPAASTPAPAASTAPASTPATPAASTPATSAPAATPAARPSSTEGQSLEQQLQARIKEGWENAGAAKPGEAEQPESEVERAAQEAAATAGATAPGEAADGAQPGDVTPEAEASAEGEYDEFAPEPAGLGPRDLAAKISADPALKAAIDANPELRDLIFANSRLAAKAKPYADMFGSPEEAQAVVAGHQSFAQIRGLLGSVKRDDIQSTQAVIAAMLDQDAMRDDDGNPMKDAQGNVITGGNTGRFLRNSLGMSLLADIAKAKQTGDNEYLAALDLVMERKGFRATSGAGEGEGENEEIKAQRAQLDQERRALDEQKAQGRREAQTQHDDRVFSRIDTALDGAVKSILDRATGLTPFLRGKTEEGIRSALKQAVTTSSAYQTELDRIERMPVGAKREAAHVALAQRYIQGYLRNAALPILAEAGITLTKKAAASATAQAARAESARSEVRSSAPPAKQAAQQPPATTNEVREQLRAKLNREPTLEEVIAVRITPGFERRSA